MPSIGDVIRLTSCKEYFGQEMCNVFYFLVAAWTGNASIDDVLAQFATLETQQLFPQLSDAVTSGIYKWENLTTGTELETFEFGIPVNGGLSGQNSAPFVAISVKLNRTSTNTRNGYKRIGGLVEDNYTDAGREVSSTTIGVFETFFNALLDWEGDPNTPGDATLTHCIVGTLPGGGKDPSNVNIVANNVIQNILTTQNTRKYGRGS